MWRDVLLANKQELLDQSRSFQRALQAMELMIANSNGEALEESIGNASRARASWRMGPPKK